MNAITRIAAVAAFSFAAAGSAFADDITLDNTTHQSLKTRAEVQAELAQFKKGANPWSTSYNVFAANKSERSREAVRAETRAANKTGELTAMTGEDSGSQYLASHPAVRATGTTLASR